MIIEPDILSVHQLPRFQEKTAQLCSQIRQLSYEGCKALWKCNDKLAALNYERFQTMNLTQNLTPAVIAYEGLQYQHMKPSVFTEGELAYIADHLRILSGFYGALSPFDGVTPYRLEMQAELEVNGCKSLYEFWGDCLYHEVMDEDRVLINLASKEYSQAIEPYLNADDTMITCIFGEEKNGKVIQKGTLAKMARGEMVRFLAEQGAETPEAMKTFTALGFRFDQEQSDSKHYVFLNK